VLFPICITKQVDLHLSSLSNLCLQTMHVAYCFRERIDCVLILINSPTKIAVGASHNYGFVCVCALQR
jgi:hypothetical protein